VIDDEVGEHDLDVGFDAPRDRALGLEHRLIAGSVNNVDLGTRKLGEGHEVVHAFGFDLNGA